ncbi:MAG: hypothetical protein M5R40_04030 [Anaerolineae bacterium]|nr:hypothetical protein [Anaerolineae bacterium]
MEIDEVGIHITLFDESSPRTLSEWLEQIIQVSNGEDISIRNLIELMRNNESAHLSLSKLGGKPQFIKSAFTIYEHGKKGEATRDS